MIKNITHVTYKTPYFNTGSPMCTFLEENGIGVIFSNTMQTVGYAYLTKEEAVVFKLKFCTDDLYEFGTQRYV